MSDNKSALSMIHDPDDAIYAVVENTQTSIKKIYNSELTITRI